MPTPPVQITPTLRLGDATQELDHPGAAKYLSTPIHVAVARALRGTRVRRAWLWVDQGVWLTALLRTTDLEQLDDELVGREPWEWVDEQDPGAAGEP